MSQESLPRVILSLVAIIMVGNQFSSLTPAKIKAGCLMMCGLTCRLGGKDLAVQLSGICVLLQAAILDRVKC